MQLAAQVDSFKRIARGCLAGKEGPSPPFSWQQSCLDAAHTMNFSKDFSSTSEAHAQALQHPYLLTWSAVLCSCGAWRQDPRLTSLCGGTGSNAA